MRYAYPYQVKKEGDAVVVSFPDIPGALTQVDPGEDFDAVVRDCLVAALGGYADLRKQPPSPSPPRNRLVVALDILMSAKLALLTAMIKAGMSNVDLAQRLGITEKAVRRMLDLDHHSRIDRLEAALDSLGQRLEVSIRPLPGRSDQDSSLRI